METILSWSSGKDSTASAILAKINGIRLDRIITVMPDPFKAELDFLNKFENFMDQKVTIIPSPAFEDYFFRIKSNKAKHPGTIYGWPFTVYKTCAKFLKWEPIKKYTRNIDCKFIIGIASNESRKILKPNESLLVKYGLTEKDSRELCIKYDLLNPLYQHFDRLGCVRCPKQTKKSFLKIKTLEPEKFQWCLDNDHLSPVKFKPNKTLAEFLS